MFNWIARHVTIGPSTTTIQIWYKVLALTNAVYFNYKYVQAMMEVQSNPN